MRHHHSLDQQGGNSCDQGALLVAGPADTFVPSSTLEYPQRWNTAGFNVLRKTEDSCSVRLVPRRLFRTCPKGGFSCRRSRPFDPICSRYRRRPCPGFGAPTGMKNGDGHPGRSRGRDRDIVVARIETSICGGWQGFFRGDPCSGCVAIVAIAWRLCRQFGGTQDLRYSPGGLWGSWVASKGIDLAVGPTAINQNR